MEASIEVLQKDRNMIAKKLAESQQFGNILYSLISSGVIDEHSGEEIFKMETTTTAKSKEIISRVLENAEFAIPLFIDALTKEGLNRLAEHISPEALDYRIPDHMHTLPYKTPSSPSLSSRQGALDDGLSLSKLCKGNRSNKDSSIILDDTIALPPIQVIPCGTPYGINDDEVYKNHSVPRGKAVLINFETFEHDYHLPRSGSQIDVDRLDQLFTQMGYSVVIPKQNMTKAEFYRFIRQFCQDQELKYIDSCIVVVMSHGRNDGHFLTSDGNGVLYDDVVQMFNNESCPLLRDKPKIFMFQCCRGNFSDYGVDINPVEVSNAMGSAVAVDAASQGVTVSIERSPRYTDMFLIFSTIQGYVSYRSDTRGTWLINVLCQVFMDNSYNTDLEVLMKKVSRCMRNSQSEHGGKQICECRAIGFDKHFYFNPSPNAGLISTDSSSPVAPHVLRNQRHLSVVNNGVNGNPVGPLSMHQGVQTNPIDILMHGDTPDARSRGITFSGRGNSEVIKNRIKRQLSNVSISAAKMQALQLLHHFMINEDDEMAETMRTVVEQITKASREKFRRSPESVNVGTGSDTQDKINCSINQDAFSNAISAKCTQKKHIFARFYSSVKKLKLKKSRRRMDVLE